MKAKIIWTPFANGGKRYIPSANTNYYPMVKLNKDECFLPWSIVLCNEKMLNQYETMGTIRFIFDHAPKNIIISGAILYLYEGKRFIATAYIE